MTFGGTLDSSNSGGLTKLGNGMLTLLGSNSYTGNTLVTSGTLALGSGLALQDSTLDTSGSGVLSFGGLSAATFGGIINGGSLALTNAVSAPLALTVGGNGASGTYSGLLSGSGGTLTKVGSGTFALTNAGDSFGGGTYVNGGSLNFANGALGSGNITFGGGALQWASGNTIDVSSRIATIASGQAAMIDTNGNPVSFAHALTGSGGLTKLGLGVLTLSASNGYSGATTISGGTLVLANSNAVSLSTVAVNAASGLQFASGIGAFNLGGLSGSSSFTLADLGASAVSVSIGGDGQSTTYSGAMSGSGGSLTKVGSGLLRLANANSYGGGTTISSGTLQLGNASGLGSTSGSLTVNAELDVNGLSPTVGALSGSGTIDNVAGGSSPTLTIGNGGGNGTFSGVIQNSSGALGLAKTGAGTQVLSGNTTLGGSLSVAGGMLQAQGTITTSGIPSITGGTLQFQGASNTSIQTSSSGYFNLSGSGAIVIQNSASVSSAGIVFLGGLASGGPAYVNQSGGSFTISGSDTLGGSYSRALTIGDYPGETSTYTLSNGLLNVPNGPTLVGWAGVGLLNISGGTANLREVLIGQNQPGGSGTLTLSNSGNLYIGSGGIQPEPSGYTINLNGGTLGALASWTGAAAMTLGGSATIDTAGNTIGLTAAVSGNGSLTKVNSGLLTLSTANTYTGNTLVSGGTLLLGSGLALQNSTFDTSGSGALSFGTLSSATFAGLTNGGSLSLTNTAAGPVALSVGNNGASSTFWAASAAAA